MTVEREYSLEIINDVRMDPGWERQHGVAWVLVGSRCVSDSQTEYRQIVASPDVFASDGEARRDALAKLSILACPIDQPLARAIKELLD